MKDFLADTTLNTDSDTSGFIEKKSVGGEETG